MAVPAPAIGIPTIERKKPFFFFLISLKSKATFSLEVKHNILLMFHQLRLCYIIIPEMT